MLKILIFSALLWTVQSSRILGLFPTTDVRRFTLGHYFMKTLAEKKHHVTMVTPFEPPEVVKNLTYVILGAGPEVPKLTSGITDKIGMNFVSRTLDVYNTAYESTEFLLSHPDFQFLLQSGQKYDLIIVEYFMNEALLGVSTYFNAPIILFSPLPSSSLMNEIFSNPSPSAYIPNILTGHTGFMSFGERLDNFFCNIFNKHYKYYFALPYQEKLLKKYINNKFTIDEVIDNLSVILLNSHPSITEPVPHTPNMIEVGGMHIEHTKPLPDDLEEFIRNSSKVVYFELNHELTNVDLGKEKIADIFKGFEKLKDVSVIWRMLIKDEKEIGDIPKNVKLYATVYPQQDIFAQDKVVTFITDGNLLRITEAVYYGKPIIGVPLIEDQKSNVARAVQDSYGIELPFTELSGNSLYNAIQRILQNKEFSYNIQKKSKLLKDQLVSPLDTAVYWVEYVIKHGGASHLQSSGMRLAVYKRHLVDIIIVLTIIDIVLFLIFYWIFKHIIHIARRKFKERKSKKYVQLEKDLETK